MIWAILIFLSFIIYSAAMLYLQWTKDNIGKTIKNTYGAVIDAQVAPVNGFELVANNMGFHTDIDVFGGETFFTDSSGTVYRLDSDGFPREFLTVEANSTSQGGLIGIAFRGDFVYLSVNVGSTWQLWEVPRINGNPQLGSKTVLLTFDNSTSAHQGGWIGFGADGYLYITLGDNGVPQLVTDMTEPWGKLLRIGIENSAYTVPPGNQHNTAVNPITKLIVGVGLSQPWRCMFYQNNLYIGDSVSGQKDVPTTQYVWRVPSDEPSLGLYEFIDNPLFSYESDFHGRIILGAFNSGEITPDENQFMFADMSSRSLFMWSVDDGVTKVPDFTVPSNILTFSRGSDGSIYAGVSNGNLYKMSQKL